MDSRKNGEVNISSEMDIITARKAVRQVAVEIGFSLTDVTRIVTSASELARNIVTYAEKGVMSWRKINGMEGKGIEITFTDKGPGIADIAQAETPGFSSGKGLGMGLSGAKRLMGELEIESLKGQGTKVTVRKWLKRYHAERSLGT